MPVRSRSRGSNFHGRFAHKQKQNTAMDTTMETKKLTFTAACNQYFGRKEGQTMGEFSAELKQLNEGDREYFKREFAKIGVEII
jgi:hypothetical protein